MTGQRRGVVSCLGVEAVLGGIVWFAWTPPQDTASLTGAIALVWVGAALLVAARVTADCPDRDAPVRAEPYVPQVGDDVWIRSHRAKFRVVDVTAGGLVTVTNLNLPMSRTTLPASWVRPVPYVTRKKAVA
jgi:hypothetical protein